MDQAKANDQSVAAPIASRFHVTIFFALAALVAAVFWYGYARSLQYDVCSGGTYLYSEDFSQEFRVGLTVFVSFVAASPVWLVHFRCRRKLPV